MISESYIKDLLLSMGYIKKNHIYEKFFPSVDCYIKVDLKNRTIIYPEDRGMTISNRTTCNFSAPENFVVLECVTRLFDKGYRPEHLNLEKEWTLGHESKGGRADICVSDQEGNTLFIVECKTYGREYEKEYKNIVNDGGQLFSYWQQERSCKFLVLYASKYEGKNDKVNMRYLAYLLNRIAYKFVSRVGNNKLMNDAMKKIVVPVPTRQLQDEFADFVQSVEKSKFECIGKKEKFEIEKDAFVHKYFR